MKEAGKHIGEGLGWLGFWLFLGMVFMRPSTIEVNLAEEKSEPTKNYFKLLDYIDKKTDWVQLKD